MTSQTERRQGRAVLILQARMGSTRLPGKSMMDMAGAPLVGRILERVKRTPGLADIVLAIPDTAADRPLAELGAAYGVSVFRGSENNLLDRYYQAALASRADIVLRLPADNVTPEPEAIAAILAYHRTGAAGFSSNLSVIGDSGWPDGIGAEAFDFAALAEIKAEEADPRRLEHVHLNFFDYSTQTPARPERYSIGTIPCPPEFRRPDLVLDVNTIEQYRFMRRIYEDLYPTNPQFHITDIIRWYDTVWLPERNRV